MRRRECVYVFYDDPKDIAEIGTSRLGGEPDLPLSVEWPKSLQEDAPHATSNFIAQIRLSDLPPIQDFSIPSNGHLWLFVTFCPRKGPELGLNAFFNGDTANVLARRAAPADAEWVLGEAIDAVPLRFEVGVSLPFGSIAFREALQDAIAKQRPSWEQLAETIVPKGADGQIGGFAFNSRGHDRARTTALRRLGRRELNSEHPWNTLAEMETSMARVPQYIRTPDELARWRESFDPLRPGVEWIEQHLNELSSWRLLIQLHPHIPAHFCIGDSWPLWVFGRSSEMAAGKFDGLAATSSP